MLRISSGCFGNNLELSFVSIFCMHVILGLVAFFIPSLGYLYSARWLLWWTSRARPFLSGHAQQQPVAECQLAARDSARCQRRAGVDGIDDAGMGAVKVDARAILISRFVSLLASACSMDITEFIGVPGQGGLACRCCNLLIIICTLQLSKYHVFIYKCICDIYTFLI